MNNVDTNSASVIECVLREHRALMRQYGEAQTRCSLLATAQAAEIERLRAEVLRLIAQLDDVVDATWPDEMDERARDLRDVRLGLWWLGERLRDHS